MNGRLATAAQLAVPTAGLTDTSSQHQHHTLVDPRTHLDFLDAYVRRLDERATIARSHATLADAAAEPEALQRRFRERADRDGLLRFQVDEIDALGLREGEDRELEEERERLRHAERLARAEARDIRTAQNDQAGLEKLLARCRELGSTATRAQGNRTPPRNPGVVLVRRAIGAAEDGAVRRGGDTQPKRRRS